MGLFDAGVPGLFKGLKSFLHPEKGYEKAQNALQPYFEQSQQYLQPYNQHGQEAYGHLSGAMEKLLNPAALHDEWLNNYHESDAARFAKERASNEGLWAANAMGLGGSTPALSAIQAGRARIGAEDEQRFIDQLLQKYLSGANIAQGIYGQGAQAGSQLGQNAYHHGQNLAELAYGRQNAPGQLFGNLIGSAANLSGAYMGNTAGNNIAKPWSTGGY